MSPCTLRRNQKLPYKLDGQVETDRLDTDVCRIDTSRALTLSKRDDSEATARESVCHRDGERFGGDVYGASRSFYGHRKGTLTDGTPAAIQKPAMIRAVK